MKVTIDPIALLKELKKMSLVVQKNTVLPILKSVKFEFGKGKVTISATDLETTYISTIDCVCEKPFELLMEFNDIVNICSAVYTPLEITVGESILLVSGKSKYKLSLLNEAENFPKIPEDAYYLDFEADGDFFYHLSVANTFKHDNDPRMDMAAIDIGKDNITIVATDSNSLYKKELPIKVGKAVIKTPIMVSSNFIGACKLFQETKISIGESFIKAEYKDEVIISRLSEQKFPTYRVVIRDNIEYNLTADRKELKNAISSISMAADFKLKQVAMSFNESSIKLKTQDIDLNKEAETEMSIDNSVPISEIAFNAEKMKHFLDSLTSETIDFSFTGVGSSIYLKPSDDETVFGLLQPMVIQNT